MAEHEQRSRGRQALSLAMKVLRSVEARLLLAVAAVAAGAAGYDDMVGGAAWYDSAYAGVQLLVMNGVPANGDDSTSTMYSLGRLLGTIAFGTTVVGLLFRLWNRRVDQARAKQTRGHLVVFGTTAEAIRVAAEAAKPGMPSRWLAPRVVLIGRPTDPQIDVLRMAGIVLVEPGDPSVLPKVLRGAREVFVAEEDDIQAIRTVAAIAGTTERVTGAEAGEPPMFPPDLTARVVLRSSDYARAVREDGTGALINARLPLDRCTVVSVAEAVAIRMAEAYPTPREARLRPVAVIGRGDLAAQLAVTSMQRWRVRGRPMRLIALTEPDDAWVDRIAPRLEGIDVALTSMRSWFEPDALLGQLRATEIAAAGQAASVGTGSHPVVFVVGLPDPTAVGLAHHIATGIPGLSVVAIVENPMRTSEISGPPFASGSSVRVHVVAELLGAAGLAELGLAQRVASAFQWLTTQQASGVARPTATAIVQFAQLVAPRSDAVADERQPILGESYVAVATELLRLSRDAEIEVVPQTNSGATGGQDDDVVVRLLLRELLKMLPADAGVSPTFRAERLHLVRAFLTALAACGLQLRPPEGTHT